VAYAAGPGDPRFHRLVTAGPAMGKTALLRAIGREVADRLGWAVTFHRCQAKERAIRAVSAEVLKTLQKRWPTELTRAVVGSVTPDHQLPGWPEERPVPGRPGPEPDDESSGAPGPDRVACSWAALKNLLELGGRLACAACGGLLVVFDDADRLGGAELESLGFLARGLSRKGAPVAFLFSGAPSLGDRLVLAGNISGCIWPTSLGRLDRGEAREALVVPAVDRGVEFREEALELLCHRADGSPLELQRLGFAAWSAALRAEVVTAADAMAGLDVLMEGAQARAS
jgi:AAA ATPase domain